MFIEIAPFLNESYRVNVFKDESDSLYFILSSKYFAEGDTDRYIYKHLKVNDKYILCLNVFQEKFKTFFIRGGRYKYNYIEFLNKDTLIGTIYISPNLIGEYYKIK